MKRAYSLWIMETILNGGAKMATATVVNGLNVEGIQGGIFKECVNSQAVYRLSERHGLEAQERR